MAPSKIRRALGAVKDQTSIGLAKVSGGGAMASELDVAIVKATRHGDNFPADERHVREVLSLTCYSRAYVAACVATLSRRLGKTRSWAVALKTLVLVHRLLFEGDPAYEQEVFFATRRGTRMLNMSDFCDRSRADAWDFSAFVRTYAAYLDDSLEHRMQGHRGGTARGGKVYERHQLCDYDDIEREEREGEGDGDVGPGAIVPRGTPARDMKTEKLFAKAQHLQHLVDRFLACRPTGAAKMNQVVAMALYPLVKESFQLYCELTELMAIFIDRFTEFDVPECTRVHAIFSRLAKQLDELDAFYSWCKAAAICRPSDFPDVERITQKKLDLMDEFIRDKSAALHQKRPLVTPAPSSPEEPPVEEYDMNAIKALPAPEEPHVTFEDKDEADKTNHDEQANALAISKLPDSGQEADFLNIKEDATTGEEHGEKLALALFDGNPAGAAPKWEAFDESSSSDWETALVHSAGGMSVQRADLGGGFNMMVLNGMYGHATANASATSMQTFTGSASSVAIRPAGAPMLALPGPPGGGAAVGGDPFAASLVVPPPACVQMSDMEKKQRFLVDEQMVWQQYARDGMQGSGSLAKLEQQKQQLHGGYNYIGYNRMY